VRRQNSRRYEIRGINPVKLFLMTIEIDGLKIVGFIFCTASTKAEPNGVAVPSAER